MRQEIQKNELKENYAEMLLCLYKQKGMHNIKFPVYSNSETKEMNISELDLSPRAEHCLKRGGIMTYGNLISSFENQDELRRIRGLGSKTANEIMLKLYFLQYTMMGSGQQKRFLRRVVELNSN